MNNRSKAILYVWISVTNTFKLDVNVDVCTQVERTFILGHLWCYTCLTL